MQPSVQTQTAGNQFSYRLVGEWTVNYAEACLSAIESIKPRTNFPTLVQCGGMTRIDITGAWLISRKIESLQETGARISLQGFRPEHLNFIERVGSFRPSPESMAMPVPAPLAQRFVRRVRGLIKSALNGLSFIGLCLVVIGQAARHPERFRFKAFVKQCEAVAVQAAPIVALISFLIAIVTAYQGGAQLKRFGAEIFSINLVTISGLREMGVLLTAIMLAGRSGSAFAAEIGTMKLNEEIDALKTTGLDPMQILVLPRILALTLMTPLLTFLADIMGFLGAGVLTIATTDMSWLLYKSRLSEAIRMQDFWLGMIKAPVFGLLIAVVGCYHGMKVANSAESVGKETTNAVVTSIFLVMFADAIFSIVFTLLNL
jgi:phospholipid/cholesterol/gamma-HCH transport system permease protein